MAVTDKAADDLDPRRLHLPELHELPRGGLRFEYDRPSDTMYVDFYGKALPAVSVPVDRGDRDYLYLRVDPETKRVVGLQIEAFLAYATKQEPYLLAAAFLAQLRGFTDIEIAQLRRAIGESVARRGWDEAAFLHQIGVRIA
ncbi:MAG: hypothetical protein IT337_07875 [Thermomicrobiales bacterium]|nr:hypothetical protein [Thermomicrobiales bacterium]